MTLPDPPVPADADLRTFRDMPLDVARLRDSDTTFDIPAEAFRCAVMLWAAAWHQVPAASLPNDDRKLARLAGLGTDLRSWRRHRKDAMRGFDLCSDDRFYHRVVVEKALKSLPLQKRNRSAAQKRWKSETENDASTMPSRAAQEPEKPRNPISQRMPGGTAKPPDRQCQTDAMGVPRVEKSSTITQQPVPVAAREPWHDVQDRLLGLLENEDPAWATRHAGEARQWLADGADPEAHIYPTVERMIASGAAKKARSLRYFTAAVMEAARENPVEAAPEDADSDAYRAIELAVERGDTKSATPIHKLRRAGKTDEANRLGRAYLERAHGQAKTA